MPEHDAARRAVASYKEFEPAYGRATHSVNEHEREEVYLFVNLLKAQKRFKKACAIYSSTLNRNSS